MRKINWKEIKASEDFERVKPGGYVAKITAVEDMEDREYLLISWDYATGYPGYNADTQKRIGYWPTQLIRSYKNNALGMFKSWYEHIEQSNPGYKFDEGNLQALVGKYMGVVVQYEEYVNKKKQVRERLKVMRTPIVADIRNGNYTLPEKNTLEKQGREAPVQTVSDSSWINVPDDVNDDSLPFN